MRPCSKLLAGALLLLMLGVPVMACLVPGADLSEAEKACCRQMANQCGHDQVPSSHSCCRPASATEQTAVAKASFRIVHYAQFSYIALPTDDLLPIFQHASADLSAVGHSPPRALHASTDILRV